MNRYTDAEMEINRRLERLEKTISAIDQRLKLISVAHIELANALRAMNKNDKTNFELLKATIKAMSARDIEQ